jgi:hypothetical protein
LDVAEVQEELKPVQLWYACALVGWFLDMLKMDPDKAMQHFGKPSEHPLRGCFEPREATGPLKEPEEYETLRFAVSGSTSAEGCLTRTQLILVGSLFVLCCPSLVQIYCWTLLKDPCQELSGWRCQQFRFLDHYGGVYITLANLILLLTARIVLGLVWRLCKRCCRVKSLVLARILTVKLLDKMALQRLPQTVGIREKIVMWGVCSLFMSFSVLAAIDMNAGILAFGNMITIYLLLVGNGLFGNFASLDMLRERHILNIVVKVAKEMDLLMNSADVRMKASEWYHTDPQFEAIVIDLPILVLLANLIWLPANAVPESVRTRKFVIPKLFAHLLDTDVKDGRWLGNVTDYSDVVVDVFERTCTVLGHDHSSSRWAEQGERLPWHFALSLARVEKHAPDLYKLGLAPGTGCFSPAPNGVSFEHNEANVPFHVMRAEASQVLSIQQNLEQLLVAVVINAESWWEDNAQETDKLVKALLKAGANVNGRRQVSDRTEEVPMALFLCMHQWPETRELCKMLIREGSDLQAKYFGANDDMTVFERQEQLGQSEAVAELKQYAASLHVD